jgi:hypothetical protein
MGRKTVENRDAKVVDNVSTMDLPTVQYPRGKTASQLDHWAGSTLGDPRQKENCNIQQILALIKCLQIQKKNINIVFACT